MTKNQQKYENLSKPFWWISNEKYAKRSRINFAHDEATGRYYTTKLGLMNGFLSLFGRVLYYIPDTDSFVVCAKRW